MIAVEQFAEWVRRRIGTIGLALGLLFLGPATAQQTSGHNPAEVVRALLDAPESTVDFTHAKVTTDALTDPGTDPQRILAEIDAMVATLHKMLATLPPKEATTSLARLQTLRTFLYRPGHWNGGRPFGYDMSDPQGQKPANGLLANYLATREGNCISMPILFIILGERLGLDVTLSTAPLHVLVKYAEPTNGTTYNLEATSGAGFTRDSWYRRHFSMSDEAIANGVYLKTLSRREAIAVIATSAVEHLLDAERYEEAIAVADIILEAYPAHAHALLKKGTAYHRLLKRDFMSKYRKESDIPPGQSGELAGDKRREG